MNYHARVIKDRIAQMKANDASNMPPGLKEGARLRLKAKAVDDDRRQRKIDATQGLKKNRNTYSAGERFDSEIHQSLDGEPIINKDGSFRKKTNWKQNV